MGEERVPNYWCIVALDYLGDCAFTMAESDDCIDDDVLADGPDVFDIVGVDWAKGRSPGLYRLTLGFDGDTGDVLVAATELMISFPVLSIDGPDYLKITQNVLHDEPLMNDEP